MSDIKIKLKEIKIFGFHGLTDEEKETGQTFSVNVAYKINKIDFNDDLSKTTDYVDIIKATEDYFTKNRYNLLEQLVVDLSTSVLNKFKQLTEVKVKVTKISPPVEATINSVSASYSIKR